MERLLSPARKKHERIAFVVRDGKPGHEIVKLAEELQIDLLVLASQGHHGFCDLLLGSTTDRVVNKAPCSVLCGAQANRLRFEMNESREEMKACLRCENQ